MEVKDLIVVVAVGAVDTSGAEGGQTWEERERRGVEKEVTLSSIGDDHTRPCRRMKLTSLELANCSCALL